MSDAHEHGEPINAAMLVRCRFCGHTQIFPPGGGQMEGCCEQIRNWPADRAAEAYELHIIPSADTAAMQ